MLPLEPLLLSALFKRVEAVYEQLHLLHLIDAKCFSDRVDLDGKLLFQGFILALFEGLVVDQERSLVDQQLKDVLDFIIL